MGDCPGRPRRRTSLTELQSDLWDQLASGRRRRCCFARVRQQQAGRSGKSVRERRKSLDAGGELHLRRFRSSYSACGFGILRGLPEDRASEVMENGRVARLRRGGSGAPGRRCWAKRGFGNAMARPFAEGPAGDITCLTEQVTSDREEESITLGSAGFQREVEEREFFLKSDDEARRRANEILRKVALLEVDRAAAASLLQFALFSFVSISRN
jgi:hypothetical protein